MKKLLITGVTGQVGYALKSQLSDAKYSDIELFALSKDALDLTNVDSIRRVVRALKPDLIINPAAYTAVDKAESEPELAYAINEKAPGVLAEEAASINAALIHFSTDYVYDGNKQTPYVETDTVSPVSVYGKSKLAGELAIQKVDLPHLILRTSWVYGAYGRNFLLTMLRLAKERDSLKIVADQKGTPTSSLSIAEAVVTLLDKWDSTSVQKNGVYHFTNTGSTTWYGFTCEILKRYLALNGHESLKTSLEKILPITTEEYPTPAARPANSVLDNSKLLDTFGIQLPIWKDGLQNVLNTLKTNTS